MPIALNDINTPRLTLRLLGDDVTTACLNEELPTATQLLHADISEEFLEHPSSLRHDQYQLQQDPAYRPWSSRAIILKSERKAIGLIRFHERPHAETEKEYRKDAVEFGYRILSSYRRMGYAREAVLAMMDWAQEQFQVHRFIASVSPDNEPSTNLVKSLGFKKIDEAIDETDGLEYVFLLERTT
ncbi:GNAT family N-acetyltransferase [Chitinophaga pendula]|uniref:GNAT family N-acetyltransferase n=1 Tax=Chitinophaga TaxID=79328 RepID=UPI000BB0886C|nr:MULTISPECIES: GNAT family N-acetyltransferase [Chitinophaga]ASZ10749.1 GNAT family N-acetyltransferase [Chitinophaga sp. MD30]UCJ06276.1 GNAT family N-acetyltransferase [Chitinophaga pendula]